MCRHVDPLDQIFHRETLTPHGIALTAISEQRGLITWNEDWVDVIFSEVDAGIAQANCVTDQPFSDAVALVKADLVKAGLAPDSVYKLDKKLQNQASPFGQDPLETTTNKGSTALFVGDESHFLWPGAIEAAVKLLEALGENPVLISRGKSNGFLASSLGLLDTARKQASTILKELEVVGASKLVVLSPGDAFTFSNLYNERLGISWPDTVEVVDLITLLANALSSGEISFEPAVTDKTSAYVDPTHASRAPNRYESPRLLLRAILPETPLELFWRKKRTHPVGNTSLQFTHPELAKALTQGRLEDARSRGIEVLYTEDPSTLFHLQNHAQEYNLEIRGLYEKLEASLSS